MRHGFSFEKRVAIVAVVAAQIAQLSCNGTQPTAPSSPQLSITGSKTLGELTPTVQLSLFQSGSSGANNVTNQAAWQSSNVAIATVSAAGLVQAVAPGNTTITGTYQGKTASTPLTVATDDDCISYSPPIAVFPNTADTPESWVAGSGSSSAHLDLGLGDTLVDANNMVAVLQRYSQLCYIGRDNLRPNRLQYILKYQRSPTGQQTVIAPQDCLAYNPGALTIVNEGTSGWAVMSGATQVALLDTSLEAAVALSVAQGFSNECFIGRQNTRLNHYDYVMEYWQ